ncbi:aminodeoxychorismate synthase component I [Simiduia agarivorans]|uniref:aminodeoxychorismate synthase n=1 Tax=Simiduia agarivorans (strain DSM 21679 / JCM 13881 / BCRC 17597 / SA1) TaxID=1117647 RepID=K4KFX7_SIMAS|nr:aminodeoxychorismate synthase component I [Simiduia agarivorans]AFU97856.1 para-aminobenzoate synthase subunit I [Simiduia agarivorans SA1 = DSM 21679]
MPLEIHHIPYQSDPGVWLSALADEPYPLMLDSNDPNLGRYHIITANPSQWLTLNGTQLSCNGASVGHFTQSDASPDICWQAIDALRQSLDPAKSELPFPGGLAGFLGYDFGVWEHLGTPPARDSIAPALWVGRYDWALIADKKQRKSHLLFDSDLSATFRNRIRDLFTELSVHQRSPVTASLNLSPDTAWPEYQQAIEQIKTYIAQGDSYQINFTQRFSGICPTLSRGIALYRDLRSKQTGPFSAFLGLNDDNQILSFSPERLVSCDQEGLVLAQPIKGTIRRGERPQDDQQLAQALSASEKDIAENLMIVDLLRNDLSKVCQPHSVSVPKLFELQSFSTVHHLVSSIKGRLCPDKQPLDLLRACFPGGSITGAPKKRAMQIIQELEQNNRSVYCGSMFYLGRNNCFDASITIRTLIRHKDNLYCWGGGGITIGSEAEAEYQESLDKIARLTNHRA